LEVELARLRIAQEQGPVAGAQQLGDLGEDDVHHLADVERRSERLADLIEHRQLVDGALELAEQVAGLHPPSVTSARVILLFDLDARAEAATAPHMRLVLCSGSPRRREMLSRI